MTRRDFIRRNGLAAAGIAVSASGCMGLFEGRRTVVRFGCVSDSHFGDLPDRGWNHFRESERKMSEAVSEFNRLGVDFAIELGDLIDSGEHDKLRVKRSLARIESVFSSCRCARYHVMGNHDFGYHVQNGCTYRILRAQVSKWANAAVVSVYEDGACDMEYVGG